jgi:2-phospho-L-lactate/phosphoenolpyruvate guanylyltransferase
VTRPGIWAVLPVKSFANAKRRLDSLLNPRERGIFAMAMFSDVLNACAASHSLSGILVVTGDAEAAQIAERSGARVLREERERGINAALRDGIAGLTRGASAMIVLPSDVPLITPGSLDGVGSLCGTGNIVAIARADRDGGTNLLACTPVGLIEPSFGPASFERHQRLAQEAGLDPVMVRGGEWALDVDTPDDVEKFLAVPSATSAHRSLVEMGVGERLKSSASRREAAFPAAMPR